MSKSVAKKRRRDQVLIVNVSSAEKQALAQAAVDQDLTASQLVRRAIKRETDALADAKKPA